MTAPPASTTAAWRPIDAPRSLMRTLAAYRAGSADPTTRLSPGSFQHATYTPDGPATLHLTWAGDPAPPDECGLAARAWGPGAGWLLGAVDALTGTRDAPIALDAGGDPVVAKALLATRSSRIGASGNLYHLLLPIVIAQRITAGEAIRQWHQLARKLGEPAPGPPEVVGELRLPPAPEALRGRPAWWFHPLGIEAKRARTLTELARHADKLWRWAASGPGVAADQLRLVPGIGPWTVGSVLGPGLGDPDAVPVGDFHFPNIVAWALAGEPRADDDRMLQLLEPYRGQRGRVLRAIVSTAGSAPKFGPRRATLPVARL